MRLPRALGQRGRLASLDLEARQPAQPLHLDAWTIRVFRDTPTRARYQDGYPLQACSDRVRLPPQSFGRRLHQTPGDQPPTHATRVNLHTFPPRTARSTGSLQADGIRPNRRAAPSTTAKPSTVPNALDGPRTRRTSASLVCPASRRTSPSLWLPGFPPAAATRRSPSRPTARAVVSSTSGAPLPRAVGRTGSPTSISTLRSPDPVAPIHAHTLKPSSSHAGRPAVARPTVCSLSAPVHDRHGQALESARQFPRDTAVREHGLLVDAFQFGAHQSFPPVADPIQWAGGGRGLP